MQITRDDVETVAGPPEWFTGHVFLDPVAVPSDRSRVNVSNVQFTPGARTAWHAHPNGQTIYVTEGVGRVQHRGGAVEAVDPATACSSSPARSIGAPRRHGS
jgi:quercetin dioxygenase-like cupin family protein